jgi:hypothetical protein
LFCLFLLFIYFITLKKGEKATTDGAAAEPELKDSDPVEKADKDFWKIIEEEKRKRDRKTVLVSLNLRRFYFIYNFSSSS